MPNSSASSTAVLAHEIARERPTSADTALALFALTKPRLGFFSVLTAMAAYSGARTAPEAGHVAATALATALAAGGALSLNHWWERRTDALMQRTRRRPLPRGAVSPRLALAWSLALGGLGTAWLYFAIDPVAAVLALATIVTYGVIYTPLKRRTRWATEIGAISGALPPLIGSAAAGDVLASTGWILFAILLFWQMPHFFAIGWKYREDYRRAGFPLLPAIDTDGARTARWSFGYTFALVVVSLVPAAAGWTGGLYAATALFSGVLMLVPAWRFLRQPARRDATAKQLFVASLLYLPLMLSAAVIDR